MSKESLAVFPSKESLAVRPLPVSGKGLTLLEHLHANTSKCERRGGTAPYLMGVHKTNNTGLFLQANCKQWDCEYCSVNNAKKWVARVVNGVNEIGGQWFFMTLTSHSKMRGETASLKNLRQGWRKIYNRIIRKFGKFNYVRVFEHHKDNTIHVHILCDVELPYKKRWGKLKGKGKKRWIYRCKYLKDISAQCGIGYQADYQPLDNAGLAAWYVSKYLGKAIGNSKFPKNLRRIQVSQKFPHLPEMEQVLEYDWSHVPSRTDFLFRAWRYWRHEKRMFYDDTVRRQIKAGEFRNFIRQLES